jgi:transposase-like protein
MSHTDTPTTILDICRHFSTENACIDYIIQMRWPEGFVCPKCQSINGYLLTNRPKIECSNPKCRYQISATAGTIMHRSKQDLRVWFWGAYLVSTLTPGISASQFQKQLGLSRYETAYNMLHKLRSALVAPERELLINEVEVDEAYIGSEEKGRPGRGSEKKVLVVCAVELVRWIDKKTGDERVRSGRIRLRSIVDASADSLVLFVKENVKKGSIVHTDGWLGYSPLPKEEYDHRPVVQGQGEDAVYMLHVHRIFSNLQTWLLGTYHGAVRKKHMQSYLNEFTYRFNRRFWRGPAFKRALSLATKAECWPTYDSLYKAGEPDGWKHKN